MSRLEELIREYCPDGVEYKAVKDVYIRLKGTPITASKMKEIADEDGDIKIFAGGKTQINAFEKNIPNANITRVPAVLVQSRGIIDVIYYDKPFTFKNEMWAYTANDRDAVKYLYYVLKNNINKFRDEASGMGSMPQISLKVTENYKIPVPALPVQREIVRVLDNFTQLTAELTAELTARKKQYEYYRGKLLTFSTDEDMTVPAEITDRQEQIKWQQDHFGFATVTLNDISENYDNMRKPVAKGKRVKGKYPYYGASGIVDYVDNYIFQGNYLLVSEDGANLNARVTPIAFSIDGKNWVNNHAHVLKFQNPFIQRYVEMYLNNMDLSPFISGAAQPKLNQQNLNIIEIMLPDKHKVEDIVSILDRFDTLCTDITSGLPAEIDARKKQYEYYRDKLLDFSHK